MIYFFNYSESTACSYCCWLRSYWHIWAHWQSRFRLQCTGHWTPPLVWYACISTSSNRAMAHSEGSRRRWKERLSYSARLYCLSESVSWTTWVTTQNSHYFSTFIDCNLLAIIVTFNICIQINFLMVKSDDKISDSTFSILCECLTTQNQQVTNNFECVKSQYFLSHFLI